MKMKAKEHKEGFLEKMDAMLGDLGTKAALISLEETLGIIGDCSDLRLVRVLLQHLNESVSVLILAKGSDLGSIEVVNVANQSQAES